MSSTLCRSHLMFPTIQTRVNSSSSGREYPMGASEYATAQGCVRGSGRAAESLCFQLNLIEFPQSLSETHY